MIGESPSSGGIVQSIAESGYTWTIVERPTDAEIDAVHRNFQLGRSDLEAALDRSGPTGIWRRNRHSIVTLHVPVAATGKQITGRASTPVTLFIGHNFVVMIHTGEVRQLIRLFRQFESDDLARADLFSTGIGGIGFAIMQSLVDAVVASRGAVERAMTALEDVSTRALESRASGREAILGAARLRTDARTVHRLATPFPVIVRSLAKLEEMGGSSEEGWDRLAARSDRLVLAAGQDLAAIDGMILAATAIAELESARSLRAILVVFALTLPVVTVVAILSLPAGNPLVNVPNAFAVSVALAGVVFLVALFGLRRRGYL